MSEWRTHEILLENNSKKEKILIFNDRPYKRLLSSRTSGFLRLIWGICTHTSIFPIVIKFILFLHILSYGMSYHTLSGVNSSFIGRQYTHCILIAPVQEHILYLLVQSTYNNDTSMIQLPFLKSIIESSLWLLNQSGLCHRNDWIGKLVLIWGGVFAFNVDITFIESRACLGDTQKGLNPIHL